MKILELFSGVTGYVITSMMLLPVLFIFWIISRKMPKSKKTNAHLNVSITLILTITYHFLNAILQGASNAYNPNYILGDVLFFSMYYGLFLLFNERTKVQQGLFYFVCLVVVSMSLLLDNSVIGNIESLLFIAFAWYYFADDIPFGSKPKWILAIFAIAKVLFFIDILTEGNTQILQFASSVLYVSSYILLLSMNVDHLMSIVQGTYQSSISDALTGLYNRRYFTRCVQQCVMKKISASTIFLDIDNFKKLNDTYGHAKGDETLKNVARILMEETEGIGVVGRYGGEEITCLIVDPTIEMDELTEMIRARIEAEASFDTSSGVCTVTASIGYSAYEEGWSVDQFIKAADKAMYASKLTGKNKVIEYGSVVYLAYKGKNSDTEMREVEGQ